MRVKALLDHLRFSAGKFPVLLHLVKDMSKLICYCFNYSVKDIEEDVIKNGRSTIQERIVREKKDGACQCHTRNPSGK